MDIVTQKGQPASILGLAGNQNMEVSCVPFAFKAGVNYFFFYNLSFDRLVSSVLKKKLFGRNMEPWCMVMARMPLRLNGLKFNST